MRSANIKQNWQHNNLSFRRGRTKVRVRMEENATIPKNNTMLEGMEDEELERYLDENLRIVPLFEIDVPGTETLMLSQRGVWVRKTSRERTH